MVFRFLRGGRAEERLERIERMLTQMLADDRHSFDIACAALFSADDTSLVGADLRATDQRVNETEREVRRALLVHLSVQGSAETPLILAYMSVAKDIERIGDYAKNIFDIAAAGASFASADDQGELSDWRNRVSEMISETSLTFTERDAGRARALIAEGGRMEDVFDDKVEGFLVSEEPGRVVVPRALFYRHMKRVVAHLMNVLSAVVQPLDMLDYHDEPRERPPGVGGG